MKLSPKSVILTLSFLLVSTICFADSKYKVNKGDTLYSISKKYQITVAELRAANNLSENDVIKVGQVLIIPTADLNNAVSLNSKAVKTETKTESKPTKTYVVQKGDTLYGIAKKSGMTVSELMALNKFDNNTVIKVGQKVMIYDGTKQTAVATTKTSTTEKEEDGKKITLTVGEVILKNEEGSYSYIIVKLPNSEKYNNLMKLATKISKFNSETNVKPWVIIIESPTPL